MNNYFDTIAVEEDPKALSIVSKVDEEKLARQGLTQKWIDLWSLYKTQPIKVRDEDGWKSKLNDGRVFELIETVGSYVRNAMFYSDRWATLETNNEEFAEIAPLASALFCDKLNASNFRKEFRLFLVQYLLTGFSSILPYWDTDNDCLAFECLNSYDVFIESTRRYNPRFSYTFRIVHLNRAEFFSWLDDGSLDFGAEDYESLWETYATEDTTRNAELDDIRSSQQLTDRLTVCVYEYYCPEERKLYRLVQEEVVFETSVEECPWLVATLYDTPEDCYPLSLIDSSIGLVLANNILHNRRLDNIALSIDNMWLFVDDGVTDPNSIRTAPGKIITVARPDTIEPLRPPANNFNVTYEEGSVLDAKIDRNVGTGAMISANSYRQAERVTKAEIEGVKDAGGNRLSDLFEMIETDVILPLLKRTLVILRDNMTKAQQVKLASSHPGVYDFYAVYAKDFKHDYIIKVTGTQAIINRDRNVSLLTEFLTLVSSVPQFQALVDYKNLYFDLLVKFGFDDPSRYMLKEDPNAEQAPAMPQSPLQEMGAQAQAIGGDPMAAAFQQQVATGGAVQAVNDLQGISPQTSQQLTPEDEALAMQTLATPPMQ